MSKQEERQNILRCLVDEIWHEHYNCGNCFDGQVCLQIINKFRDGIKKE